MHRARFRPPSRRARWVRLAGASALLLAAASAVGAPRRVVDLDWSGDPGGATTVVVTFDDDLVEGDFRSYMVPEPPRAVVVIRAISETLEPRTIPVGDRNVVQIRTGLHRAGGAPELHLVFDLTDPAVRLLEVSGNRAALRVILGPPPGPTASATPLPSPPPPTSTPPGPPPAATPSSSPDPGPPAAPTSGPPSPVVRPDPGPATRVTGITASPRGDGSTLLLVTADGRLADGCARVIEVADEPARIIVTLRGLQAPDLPRTLELGDEIVLRVRLIHDAETSHGELHLVLHLSDGAVAVTDLNQVGEHLVVHLARPDAAGSAP
ncbi:MAG TPA: hypothetical protein VLT32_09285 [Candidatus Sulfomarinibacteraceae bacterium]|nr:hypothetical protein [Candidatus Sulfomarinibacteraceae bacterium]